MKKLVILGTALLSLSLVASEIQIKGGYDFNRNQVSTSDTVLDFGNGATAGAEYIFDNQGEFEWGIGAEYKFDQKFKGNDTKWMRQIPGSPGGAAGPTCRRISLRITFTIPPQPC